MKKILFLLVFSNLIFAGKINIDNLLNYNIDSSKVDETLGEELYVKKYKCSACHGKKGERKSGTFSSINSLSASELKSILIKYKDDRDFGGKTRFAMQRYAKRLSHEEMDNIIAYIKGRYNLGLPDSKNAEPTKTTKDGLFIE